MKIGILVDEIAPGSAPKLIGWPIRKLKELGVEAEALVIIEKDHWEKNRAHYDFHLQGAPLRYLVPRCPGWARKINFKFPGMSFFSLHHVLSLFFAHRAVKDREFDVILALCQYSAFAARNIFKKRRIPFLLHVWDPSTYTAEKIYKNRMGALKYKLLCFMAGWLDRFAFKKCLGATITCSFHEKSFRRLTEKPLEKLPPGCFIKEHPAHFQRRLPMILTYDRWDIGNIPVIFLDILRKLARKDIRLTIGGFWHPRALKDDFEKEVEKRELRDRVRLLGGLNEDKIMELCSEAYVHVHPVHEAFGMQSLEAAACGCPIIIPAGSGVTELFEHGKSGLFPENPTIDEFVKHLDFLFANMDKAAQMGREAWLAARNYTWEKHAERLLEIAEKYAAYDEAVHRPQTTDHSQKREK